MMGRQRRDQGKLFYEFRLRIASPRTIYCAGSTCSSRQCWPTYTKGAQAWRHLITHSTWRDCGR